MIDLLFDHTNKREESAGIDSSVGSSLFTAFGVPCNKRDIQPTLAALFVNIFSSEIVVQSLNPV